MKLKDTVPFDLSENDQPLGITGGSENDPAAFPTPVIGTLGEGSMHSYLKAYYQPESAFWEQKVSRFVADIYDGEQITEIQTGNFRALREKLPAYAALGIKTKVVYPIREKKQLIFTDENGHELRRSTGRRTHPFTFFQELWQCWKQVDFDFVSFDLVFLSVTDYKVEYKGRAYGKRRRTDTVVQAVLGVDSFCTPAALLSLLPAGLPVPFTVKELAAAAKAPHRLANEACLVLRSFGALAFAGKDKNAYLYTPVIPED